jgi:hypothetical protein
MAGNERPVEEQPQPQGEEDFTHDNGRENAQSTKGKALLRESGVPSLWTEEIQGAT